MCQKWYVILAIHVYKRTRISFYMVNKWWIRFCLVYNIDWFYVKDLGKYWGTFWIKLKDCKALLCSNGANGRNSSRLGYMSKLFLVFKEDNILFSGKTLKNFAWVLNILLRTWMCTLCCCSFTCSLLWIILIIDPKCPLYFPRSLTQYQGMLYTKKNLRHHLFIS